MSTLISKTFRHLRYSARSSLTVLNSYGTKAIDKSLNLAKKDSFIVSYLVDKCGFAPEKALTASKYTNFEIPDKPDSVLSFLKNHGFTDAQVPKLVQRLPAILLCNPQNTLLPKIEFFKSLGFTVEDYTAILCGGPSIFKSSVEKRLLPTIDFLKKFLDSPEKIRVCMKRNPWIFSTTCQALIEDNIQLLREMEVPESSITQYFRMQPRLFSQGTNKFKKILEEVEGMGFEPSRKKFMVAVHVFCSMNRLTWEKKIVVYKKWGLSEDQILEAFGRSPWLMSCSEEKIGLAMDFLVNKMGFKSSDILRAPMTILLSLKNRIIPRCFVLQTLIAKGLLKQDIRLLARMLMPSEDKFIMMFVQCYENKVPDLLKLYQTSSCSSIGNPKVDFP